jgi:DNA-binding NarL/FixJ family response regulator
VVTAETAAAIVDETDQVWLAAFPHAVAVFPLAARGEWDRAGRHLAAARTAADATRGGAARLWARLAALRLAESRHDPAAVVAAGEALGGVPAGPAVPRDEAIVPWRAAFAEALAGLGRVDEAAAVVDWLAADTAASPHPLVRSDLDRARIAVTSAAGDAGRAAELAARAVGPDAAVAAGGEFARGQLELVAARALAAAGDHDVAGRALAAARRRFAGLRAEPWVAAVDREPGAAGGRRRARRGAARPAEAAELTPQEQAVVHVVARGATNREAADELFISIKTVEHHLSRAYAKLGVRTRTELAGVVAVTAGTPTTP